MNQNTRYLALNLASVVVLSLLFFAASTLAQSNYWEGGGGGGSAIIPSTPSINLVVDNRFLKVIPLAPVLGESITTTGTIKNEGSTIAKNVEYSMELYDPTDTRVYSVSSSVGDLAIGQSKQAMDTFSKFTLPGVYRVRLTASHGSHVQESAPNDNQAELALVVYGKEKDDMKPDLMVQQFTYAFTGRGNPNRMNYNVVIENKGTASVESLKVQLLVSELQVEPETRCIGLTLKPGDRCNESGFAFRLDGGTLNEFPFQISVKIDPQNHVDELIETNNEQTIVFPLPVTNASSDILIEAEQNQSNQSSSTEGHLTLNDTNVALDDVGATLAPNSSEPTSASERFTETVQLVNATLTITSTPEGTALLSTGTTKVILHEPAIVDAQTVYLLIPNKTRVAVELLPNEVVHNLPTSTEVQSISLSLERETPVYTITHTEPGKLFGFITIKTKSRTRINAVTGDLIDVGKPWWARFVN